MYRDDRDALQHQLEALHREAEVLRSQNCAMREELLASNGGLSLTAQDVYGADISHLSSGQRAALAHHTLTPFPAWAIPILTLVTLGIFPLIHFGVQHDKLPRAAANDPTAGRAIGFTFVPYFNLYWVFFNSMRLADRLNLQLRIRGEEPSTLIKGLMITCSIFTVFPWLNLLLALPLWAIGGAVLQHTANRVAALPPLVAAADPYALPPEGLLGP